MRSRATVLRAAVTGVVVALGIGLAAQPAMAQSADTPGACSATGVKTGNLVVLSLGLKLGAANPNSAVCATDYQKVLGASVPIAGALNPLRTLLGVNTGTLLQVGVVEGLTGNLPNNNGAGATARVAYVRLNVLGFVLEIGGVESHARARLDGCDQSTFGYSDVASLKINGKAQGILDGPVRIPLLGLGAIYLNQAVQDGPGSLAQRAVHVDLPGDSLDITLGESFAFSGACAP